MSGATSFSQMQLLLDFDLGPRWSQPAYTIAIEADGKRLTTLSMAGQLVYLVSRSPEVSQIVAHRTHGQAAECRDGGSGASF